MGFLDRFFSKKSSEITNPLLVQAMDAVARNDNIKTRRFLYETLLNSQLLVPTPTDMGNAGVNGGLLEAGSHINLVTGQNREGYPVMFVFTDPSALLMWQPECSKYLTMKASDIFPFAISHNFFSIVVNPAGPTGGEICQREISALAEGFIPEFDGSNHLGLVVEEDTTALVGRPAQKPSDEFLDILRTTMGLYPEILNSFYYQMVIGKGKPHLVIGVQLVQPTDRDRQKEIFGNLFQKTQPVLKPDEFIDFMVLDQEAVEQGQTYLTAIL